MNIVTAPFLIRIVTVSKKRQRYGGDSPQINPLFHQKLDLVDTGNPLAVAPNNRADRMSATR